MNAKENFIEAIRFGRPEHVPLMNEPVMHRFQLEGNFKAENWTDAWGTEWEVGIESTVPFPKGNPLTDIKKLADYKIPDPGGLIFNEDMKRSLTAINRSERLVTGDLTYLIFERAWAVMGMDNFLTAMVTDPDEIHEFLHGIAGYARAVFDRYLELGADAVGCTEDLGSQRSLIMSPRMFREFFLPEYVYCFENVLKAGKFVFFHSCGCINEVASDLAGIGITMINPVQARANDLGKLKADTMGRMALCGGIDTAVFANGTAAYVEKEVIRVMDILKPGGGYVCGPDQGLPDVLEKNVEVLWQTAKRTGRY